MNSNTEQKFRNISIKILLAKYVYSAFFFVITVVYLFQFNRILFCRCYLKLGSWQENLEGLTENSIPSILKYFEESKCLNPSCYKVCHSWALINYKMVLHYKQQQNNTNINQVIY